MDDFIVVTTDDANNAVYETIATYIQAKIRRHISDMSPCEVLNTLTKDRRRNVIQNVYTLYTCARFVAPIAYKLARVAIVRFP